MSSLRERLSDPNRFVIGTEIVTTRGKIPKNLTQFCEDVSHSDRIDFANITDNPGGNPMILPENLGQTLLSAGKNVVIHLTCKDSNRNALESRAWNLAAQGFENILCMTGDFPVEGFQGLPRPVFDLDSVSLLALLSEIEGGMRVKRKTWERLEPNPFFLGAVVSPFKKYERELIPQYMKLRQKIENGADFIITQLGYDSRKFHELLCVIGAHNWEIPAIANVYVLTRGIARVFNRGTMAGCVVSDELKEICEKAFESPDKGKSFFLEFAAKQVAIARGMGYRGAYIGGVHTCPDIMRVLDIEATFAPDDWKEFAKEIQYPQPDEFYVFAKDEESGLNQPGVLSPEKQEADTPRGRGQSRKRNARGYGFSRLVHDCFFARGSWGHRMGRGFYGWVDKHKRIEKTLHGFEKAVKAVLFECRDCGDCSLPDIAYLCPMSQCAKDQRNGPCGGTKQGRCEVDANDRECIWGRAFDRLKSRNEEKQLLDHAPVFPDRALDGTSSWANNFLDRDHLSPGKELPEVGEKGEA